MSTRTFPLDVVLSLTTGTLLCRFSDMHELIEHVAGEPVWTHQLASQPFTDQLKAAVVRQHPWLANVIDPDFTGVDREDMQVACLSYVAHVRLEHGVSELPIESGSIHTSFASGLENLGKGRQA